MVMKIKQHIGWVTKTKNQELLFLNLLYRNKTVDFPPQDPHASHSLFSYICW